MDTYRTNAKEEEEVMERTKVWRGAWMQVLMRLALLLGIMLIGTTGYGVVHWLRAPAPPAACRDSATIVPPHGFDTSATCPEGASHETTQLKEGNETAVLVRCFCRGHEKPASKP